jgi:serine/threonine protein kinase
MTLPQQRVDELFEQAIAFPPDARAQFLVEACGLDSELRAEVLSLLEHDERAKPDFLAPPSFPPYQGGIEGGAADGPDGLIGKQVGKYSIRRVIAGGGMGRVYEAEQDNPKRTVALKVVPTWAWSPAGRRRFEFEVEALARLTHPNIAQIYDAGTFGGNVETPKNRNAETDDQSRRREPTDILPNDGSTPDDRVAGLAPGALTHGIPYFVMEFVPNAMPITDYAERHELTVRQRLELILQLCDAVHYGHQKGIIHRDLKPANILVASESEPQALARGHLDQGSSPDGARRPVACAPGSDHSVRTPLVKVIDFGIAKATDSDVTATTMHTEIGQLVGTLSYMSPEQCAADPLALDVRTDVYSLGVVLYQLLCGCLPYAAMPTDRSRGCEPADNQSRERKRPDDQSRRREPADVPPSDDSAPDERVTGLAPDALIPNPLSMLRTICEVPPIRPSIFEPALRGDLEIILLKALEKDRQKRYQSAADLARDIRHYLAREPIEARGPSLASYAFLWTRRHPILTTAIAAATIGITILATAWTTVYLAHQRPYHIEFRDATREAVLVSYNGNVLHTWNSLAKDPMQVARIVSLPNETPSRLLFLGFHSTHPGPLRGRLCAYDIDAREYDVPKWTTRIEPDDVPTVEPEEGFVAEEFSPQRLFGPFDVFPETPGLEIVSTFSHSRSRRAIQVISSKGEVLFQIWHDGTVLSAYWLSEARLLVFAGTNDEVPWADRGVPGNERQYYPWVVWAVRPILGQRANRYVCTGRFEDCIAPAWYKCVIPFEQTDAFRDIGVDTPLNAAQEDGEHFCLKMTYTKTIFVAVIGEEGYAGAGWVVDAEGKEGGEPYYRNDAYLQFAGEGKVTPIEKFYLGPLPPIIRPPTTE